MDAEHPISLAHHLKHCVIRAQHARRVGDSAVYRRLVEEFLFVSHACASSLAPRDLTALAHILPRVLLVSDHPSVPRLMRECLIAHAYAIHLESIVHPSLERVLDHVSEDRPHLLLIASALTLDRGINALHRIRKHPLGRKIPVIALGERQPGSEAVLAVAAGASEYLPMPDSVEAYGPLIERMRFHLGEFAQHKSVSDAYPNAELVQQSVMRGD